MTKLRIGFIGAGRMGQAGHLRNYLTEPDCEVVAIAELRPRLREAVRARYGIARGYADHRQLLADGGIDAIVAPQPFRLHGQLIPELLASGLPVMTEKPIGRSLAVAERIATASRAARGGLYVGYHKRSDPAVIHAKAAIERLRASGDLGRLTYVRLCMPPGDSVAEGYSQNVSSDESYPDVTFDAPPAGLDAAQAEEHVAFVNYYIHQVNLMRHLLGEPYEVRYADPAGVVMAVSSVSGIPGLLEMAPYRTSAEWQEHATVHFERGYVRIDLPAPLAFNRPGRVTLFSDRGGGELATLTEPTLPWVHAMRNQARAFIRACRGEPTQLCRADEARDDLAIADRYIAMRTAACAAPRATSARTSLALAAS